MATKTPRKTWLVVLSSTAAAIAYLVVFYLPGEEAIAKLRNELAVTEQFIEQTELIAPTIQLTQATYDKIAGYNATWDERSPEEAELSSLFGRINLLAKASGATTTHFDPESPIPHEEIRLITVRTGCTGSFAQIAEFLCELERLDQPIWIENLQMEKSGGDANDLVVEMKLVIFADNPDNSDQGDASE